MRTGAAQTTAPNQKQSTHSPGSREITMRAIHVRLGAFSVALALAATLSTAATAQKKYDTGANDTEIKIGNIMPYSGPLSAYGLIGKTEAAYFEKINAEAASTAARSNSSPTTTASALRKRSSRRASWWRATRNCSSSRASARRPTPRSKNT